ncbi:MAG: DegT/DnrJ/EryC1/StrS family aminotransferase, partial [Synergistaceae bacterium]|nr:DegT/DnrJ/EryC1/StrS family aminotransferase [Synergistaceae bacterium]
FVARRREIAQLYLRELAGIEGLTLPPEKNGHAWHLFVARIDNAELHGEFFAYMRDNDIRLQVHYRPVPLQPYYRNKYGYKAGDFPEAERYYREAVSLPIFPLMTDDDAMRVVECIKNFTWR